MLSSCALVHPFLGGYPNYLRHFQNFLPRFLENLPRFWKKLRRFSDFVGDFFCALPHSVYPLEF